MIDHLGIGVRDIAASKRFYVAALEPLGIGVIMEFDSAVGLGSGGKPYFWLGTGNKLGLGHLAFLAKNRATVDAFHRAALAAGATDNGAPGLRPHYHPDYYGAFVLDLDGNNIEAVCHTPLGAAPARKARPTVRKVVRKAVKKTVKKPAKKKLAKKKSAPKKAKNRKAKQGRRR